MPDLLLISRKARLGDYVPGPSPHHAGNGNVVRAYSLSLIIAVLYMYLDEVKGLLGKNEKGPLIHP